MSRKEKDNRPLRFAILTVSNSRTYSDDTRRGIRLWIMPL